MTTITTKIAESGRTSFQLNGKRASEAAAIEAAIANMKNGSDNLVDIQIAIDAAKKTVRFDINYYGEIIWQEIKSVKQYKSIGGGYYETYYSPEWTRTTEERANELFAEFGLNTEIICKMVFAVNTDTTTETEDNTEADIEKYLAAKQEVSFKYYYHEIGRMSEQDVIELAQSEGSEFVNALCKFIANDTDGSEEDDAESFTANVMPAEDDDTDDELIDPPDRRTIERNSGTFTTWINGEFVSFENHSIAYINAEKKLGYHYKKSDAGRKIFYRGNQRFAASKIAEVYMNGEIAAEQNKAHHEFFDAHKLEVGNPFKVSFEITTADGQEHFFSRTFETFAEAKALVDEFTATFSEPTQIVIKQNKQNGDWFYSRDTDGTEKFFDAFCKLNATEEDKPTKKAPAKVDRLTELKASKLLIYKAINNALRGHYVKLESGEFCDASEAGFTTIGVTPSIFDKLYFKDENGAYVEVSEKAIYAFNRLEVEHDIVCDAIKAEIARTTVKFEVGKWYASDETDWNGNPCGDGYRVLKRTKKFVTIYDSNNDDWHYIDNYDPDDEIDGEFDCIFRKKIQFDERGEYVDWRDEDGDLVTLCAKDVTDKPVDEDPDDDDAEDDADKDAAEDNVETETVNDEKPKHTTVEELNQPTTAEELYKMFAKTIVNANAMNVTLQNGRKMLETHFEGAYVTPEYYYKHWFIKDNVGFLFARYDTPAQVETVINMLKAAIERGDKEFTFPTVEELTATTVETPEHTTDDFTAKSAELKAERDAKQKAVVEKQSALIKAQAEHETAVEAWRESNYAVGRLGEIEAENLSAKLLPLNIAAVKVTKQDGFADYVYTETLVIRYDEGKFIISGDCSIKKFCTLARYDTPEQVTHVINGLKAAAEHETKFKFPTVEELNQPPTVEEVTADKTSKPAEVKRGAKFVEGKFYNDMDWATFGAGKKCFKILKRTACYVTIGDYSPFWHNYFENGRYKIQTDSDGNEYTNYWSGERLCAQFLTVDEHIRGSLKRAAEIARKKYHEYKREGDKAGMRRESELFEICLKAIKELEAA